MDQPAKPAASPEPVAGPATPQVDIAQIKTMLNLPDTASDVELITALVELVTNLQQKYEALLSDAVAMEDKLTNRDLADFGDIVTPETEGFWREQILANREGAIAVLTQLRATKPPTLEVLPPPAPRVPLRNRLSDQPRSIATLAGAPPAGDPASAAKIRNRAMEIRKSERVPYAEAFARAEKELNPT